MQNRQGQEKLFNGSIGYPQEQHSEHSAANHVGGVHNIQCSNHSRAAAFIGSFLNHGVQWHNKQSAKKANHGKVKQYPDIGWNPYKLTDTEQRSLSIG